RGALREMVTPPRSLCGLHRPVHELGIAGQKVLADHGHSVNDSVSISFPGNAGIMTEPYRHDTHPGVARRYSTSTRSTGFPSHETSPSCRVRREGLVSRRERQLYGGH